MNHLGIKSRYPKLEQAALAGLAFAPQNCKRAWELLNRPTSSEDRLERTQLGSKLNDLLFDLLPYVRQHRPQ